MRWVLAFIPRLALSAIFIRSGFKGLRNPDRQVQLAEQELPVAIPRLDLVTRLQAGVQLAGGVALAAGIAPGIAAAGLAATMIPVTYVGHPFWKHQDPQARNQHLVHFLKNVGLFGGLLYIAVHERQHGTQPS